MRKTTVVLALLFVAAVSSRASASGIYYDPATLHIGTGAGTLCAQGCGGDPNVISSTTLSIFQNQGGGDDLLAPTLLIVGIPDYSGAPPTISDVVEYDPYDTTLVGPVAFSGGADAYGLTTPTFFDSWPSSSSEDVYAFLGLNANNSNNTSNWFSGPNAGASSFGIYVYSINGTLGAKGLFDVVWGGSGLADGSIAIAYGCSEITTQATRKLAAGVCNGEGNTYSTPFTEAGRVTESTESTETTETTENVEITETTENVETTPEPAMLVLFGSGLAIAAARLRRRKPSEKM
jgi:hypothetical protein